MDDEILIPSKNGMLSIIEFNDSYQVIFYLNDNNGFLVMEDLMLTSIEHVTKEIDKLVE
jgi:hypothetical protein